MKKHISLVVVVISIAMLVLAGCKGSAASRPQNIFLITLDTARADFLNTALENNDLTPNFARLASEGVVFENACTLIPITLPSHASMLYSLPPHLLKVYNNGNINRAQEPSLSQLLQKEGFRTGAVVSLGVLRAEAGLNTGFDQYLENFRPGLWYRTADEVNADAMKLVREFKGQPAFFWIHYSDPHGPYFSPEYRERFRIIFNDVEIFSSRSTDQMLVDLELDLAPGRNILDLNVKLPEIDQSGKPLKINNIAFLNFALEGLPDTGTVAVELAPDWNRVEQRRDNVAYFTRRADSRVEFLNRERETRKVRLSFLLKLHLAPRSAKALYREEMVYLDREFGRFIDFLKSEGLYQDSVFLVMGDHGEGLGEIKNAHVGHIHYLNRVYSHVPLFIAGKGVRRAAPRRESVSNLDVAPTILELAGEKKAPHMLGISLLREKLPQRRLLLASYAPEAFRDTFSLVDFPYQLIFTPGLPDGERLEFLNLENDAFGGRNLFADPEAAPKLKAELVNALKELARTIAEGKQKPGSYSKRQQEILKSLGYL